MRLHRFYTGKDLELKHDFWLHDERLINQWRRVLRFGPGQEVILFDGLAEDRLYKLMELTDREAHLQLVTELKRQTPKREIYLMWSLLKKDKNDWVLQKCTELGVSHFVPLLAERCARSDLSQNMTERWERIVVEAAEQCGRSDIPTIREPMKVATVIDEFQAKVNLLVCEQSDVIEDSSLQPMDSKMPFGVLVGPEGGWSDGEKQLFKDNSIQHLNLHDFTLRAETAAIIACLNAVGL